MEQSQQLKKLTFVTSSFQLYIKVLVTQIALLAKKMTVHIFKVVLEISQLAIYTLVTTLLLSLPQADICQPWYWVR